MRRIGFSFWRFQLLLCAIAVAISCLFFVVAGKADAPSKFLFTFIIGNGTAFTTEFTTPLFSQRKPPWDWLTYLSILLPISALASALASVTNRLVLRHANHLLPFDWGDIQLGILFSVAIGASIFASAKARDRLEARNRELEKQVTVGQISLQAHEAELKTAHEIQAHLLPSELPQMRPFTIASAWQPARSVGGDYFDVLTLSPHQLGVCIADVSGKGITAALLMANLQAAVRAFAPQYSQPSALCGKLNEVLCNSIAPGKFVTFFYGIIDSTNLTLRFENAGHSQPIILRGEETIILTEGGTVLGLFPTATYDDRQCTLRRGDCLLLTTDGVTEAANENDEEFGNEGIISSARVVRTLGAQAIRSRIIEDVTKFCQGTFHDDASLIVITVDS